MTCHQCEGFDREFKAEHRMVGDRIEFRFGEFVEISGDLPAADVVTLDRVICCFEDMPALVHEAASGAGRALASAYPHDAWWVEFALRFEIACHRARRCAFRMYHEPTAAIDVVIRDAGRARVYREAQPVQAGRAGHPACPPCRPISESLMAPCNLANRYA